MTWQGKRMNWAASRAARLSVQMQCPECFPPTIQCMLGCHVLDEMGCGHNVLGHRSDQQAQTASQR